MMHCFRLDVSATTLGGGDDATPVQAGGFVGRIQRFRKRGRVRRVQPDNSTAQLCGRCIGGSAEGPNRVQLLRQSCESVHGARFKRLLDLNCSVPHARVNVPDGASPAAAPPRARARARRRHAA